MSREFTIYLIRHGESVVNKNPEILGQLPNTPLSERGESQSKFLGEFFDKKQIKFDYIFSSTFDRALNTTRIACANMGEDFNDVITSKEIVEYNAGDWIGKHRDEILTNQVMHRLSDQSMNFQFPNGETLNQVQRRSTEWLEKSIINNPDLIKENRDLKIAVFSHGNTIRTILQYILGFDRNLTFKIKIENTSISIIRWNDRGWFVDCINSTPHL